jgi:hypothetical protein
VKSKEFGLWRMSINSFSEGTDFNSRIYISTMKARCILFLFVLSAGLAAMSVGAMEMPYHPPQSYDLQTLYKQAKADCHKNDWPCFENELFGFTMTYGPKAAVDTFKLLVANNDIPPTIDAHHFVHHVGHHTAMAFGSNIQAFDLCPVDFDYGCMHGFFQYALSTGGMTEVAAVNICKQVAKEPSVLPKTIYECYHGLGHGIMMHDDHDLMKSLNFCDSLKLPSGQDGCWQGVFMENVDVAEAGQWQKGMFSEQDPLAPCDKMAAKYQHECYINHSGWLMRFYGNDVAKGSRACLNADPAEVNTCLQTLGLAATNPAWQHNLLQDAYTTNFAENGWMICKKFPQYFVDVCVLAAVDNIMNSTTLGAPIIYKAQSFCQVVDPVYRSMCFKQIGKDALNLAPDTKTAREACLFMKDDSEQQPCLSAINT